MQYAICQETWFQPIVDTKFDEHHILGHECLIQTGDRPASEHGTLLAIRAASREAKEGLYFLPAPACLGSAMKALDYSGMQPENLVFEAADLADLKRTRNLFRGRGFGLALSNAGMGSEPLDAIRDLKPDYLKLNPGLVRGVERPAHAAAIQRLVGLADRFGTIVIAEGVDRARTMENLWLLGVQYMQGDLFGRPEPRVSQPGNVLISLLPALSLCN